MALQGADDALPPDLRRILVTGSSGAGKTTLCRAIGAILHIPAVEIDSLYHGPDWIPRPGFVADVDEFTSGPAWVIEWLYAEVKPLLLSRSDGLIWLDHGRWTVMQRVVRRTIWRRLTRRELWNGNYEPPLRTLLADPDHIIRWSWRTHHRRAQQALAVADQADGPIVVRLRGQSEVHAWLRGPLAALAASNDPR